MFRKDIVENSNLAHIHLLLCHSQKLVDVNFLDRVREAAKKLFFSGLATEA